MEVRAIWLIQAAHSDEQRNSNALDLAQLLVIRQIVKNILKGSTTGEDVPETGVKLEPEIKEENSIKPEPNFKEEDTS